MVRASSSNSTSTIHNISLFISIAIVHNSNLQSNTFKIAYVKIAHVLFGITSSLSLTLTQIVCDI